MKRLESADRSVSPSRFGKAAALRVLKQRNVRVGGRFKAQKALEIALSRRGGQDVVPAHDFVYAAERVIHDDGELIAEKPVGAAQNEIAAVAREILLIQPVVAVADGNRFIRHAQAVRGAAGFQLLRDGLRERWAHVPA